MVAARPVEPPPCPWFLPDPATAGVDQELIAVGADLEPGTMLAGYRRGLFPMGVDLPDGEPGLGWWSPNPRAILRPDSVHVSRSLKRSLKRFEYSVDRAFDAVVAACGDPSRKHGWITGEFRRAYQRMFELGWAHSVEVWLPEGQGSRRLVGGLFGLQIGGFFAAESKFHRETDASKAAVVRLCESLGADGAGGERIIDVQWPTKHLMTLGVEPVERLRYLHMLRAAQELPSPTLR
ncbi:MAG: leucyl/phenylalanyl-tRNA--protein transferase [Candidatus Nanopelagicales bacterium]